MTPQEAIKNIDDILDSPYLFDESIDYQLTTDDIECLEMAKKALEKQIPKKPLPYKGFEGKCACGVVFLDRSTNYCGNCGQALDWGSPNERNT